MIIGQLRLRVPHRPWISYSVLLLWLSFFLSSPSFLHNHNGRNSRVRSRKSPARRWLPRPRPRILGGCGLYFLQVLHCNHPRRLPWPDHRPIAPVLGRNMVVRRPACAERDRQRRAVRQVCPPSHAAVIRSQCIVRRSPSASKNKFVELALKHTLALVLDLRSPAEIEAALSSGLDITIVGDNDFYSQQEQVHFISCDFGKCTLVLTSLDDMYLAENPQPRAHPRFPFPAATFPPNKCPPL